MTRDDIDRKSTGLHTPWKEICAASIGNALEFYDLLIYGYFAIIIGKQFFPSSDPTTSLLLSVASFAVSFLTRPLGAMLLGSYADRAGRKAALTLSISLMMIGTGAIAIVPSYSLIGLWAPILVVAARMVQGISTGGEFGAATAFMVEQANSRRRGFYASWQMSSLGLATVLAAGLSAFLSAVLSPDQVTEWGWRIAFAAGLLIGPVGIYIRRNIDETADFQRLAETQPRRTPLRDVIVRDWRNVLVGIGAVAAATAFNYVHKVYMPTYAVRQLHLTATSSFLGAVVTGLILMIAAPIVGIVSDRYGRVKVMGISLMLVAVTTYPLFLALITWPTPTSLMLVQTLVGILLAICLGALPALLADIYPAATRGTGLALSYNFSVTLFGGFAPLIVTWLIKVTHSKLAPSYYVMATALISLIAIAVLSNRKATTDASGAEASSSIV